MLRLGPGSHRRERKVGDALWPSESGAQRSPPVRVPSLTSVVTARESGRTRFCPFIFKEVERGWGSFASRCGARHSLVSAWDFPR